MHDLAWNFPGCVGLRIGYDEAMSHRLFAGADAVLVPSRFEPCGLVQLIAQRYGTLPIGHATGGLQDTIRDPFFTPLKRAEEVEDPWKSATGVLFSPLNAQALVDGAARVGALGASGRLKEVQRRLMAKDVSWDGPAQSWEAILTEVSTEGRLRL